MLLVQGRVRDSHSVQLLDDSDNAVAADEFIVNHPNHGSRFLVDDQLVIIVGIFHISVGSECSDKLSLLPVIVERSSDIDRGGSGVAFVDDVCNAD